MVPLAKALPCRPKKLSTLCFGHRGGWSHDAFSRPANPGPLLVAGELEVDLGRMIVGGLIVGSFGMAGAFAYARWYNGKYPMEVRSMDESDAGVFSKIAEIKEAQLLPLFSLSPLPCPFCSLQGIPF